MHDFHWPALVTLGVLVMLFALAWNVGRARANYKISAPAITGDPGFERVFRAHQNTVENTVMFLPALWLFAVFVNGLWAGALGAVWIGARAWYAAAYTQDAGKRGPPFLVSTLVFCALTLGAAWGVVRSLLES